MTFADIQKLFVDELKADSKIQQIYKTITDGGGNYRTAAAYADRLGLIWSNVLQKTVGTFETIPSDLVNSLLFPSLMSDYEMSAEMATLVQKALNQRAGIGLKALTAETDKEQINAIMTRLVQGEDASMLRQPVLSQLAKNAVNDTIEVNAKFQSKAGLKSYIHRSSASGCCDWCKEVSGTFEYGEQPSDFFKQHDNCDCVITFMPSKNKWERITFGMATDSNGKAVRTQTRETL